MKMTITHATALRLTLVMAALLAASAVRADNYLFRQLFVREKFPTSVSAVYAEENGFIWVGSREGLGKFDGYTLKMYTSGKDDPYSLPGNRILKIEEDSLQNIWVLTDRGLARYIRQTDNFEVCRDTEGKNILASSIRKVAGGILFGAMNEIYRYDYRQQTLQRLVGFATSKNFAIHEICPWDEQTFLCINIWQGARLLDKNSGEIKPPPFEKYEDINRLMPDSRGYFWTAAYNQGITCFDRQGKMVASYTTQNSPLSCDVILCMIEYKGNIWVGTDGGGINILDPEKGTVTTLEHIPGNKNSLPANSIECLYGRDDSDDLWAGSIRRGLVNICRSFIRSYSDAALNSPDGLSEKAVLSFYQDASSQEIWIGTDGGGIDRYDPKEHTFVHHPATWGEKITSLCSYTDRELLVSLFSKGLYVFDKRAGTLRPLRNGSGEAVDREARYGRKGVNLCQDEPGSVLILSTHLYRYDLNTRRIRKLTDETFQPDKNILYIDHDSVYTYLYDQHHIYALHRKADNLQTIYADKQKNLGCVARDKQGVFYLGSEEGVHTYRPATRQPEKIGNELLKEVKSLVFDDNGRLWIGTNGILCVWKTTEHKLILFGESDGAITNEYLDKAILRAKGGDIYMGGVNGMIHISGSLKEDLFQTPQLVLTELLGNGKNILPLMDTRRQAVTLADEYKTLTVKVMARENDIFRKRVYRFRLDGPDDQLVESDHPQITLRSLQPGTYRLTASCSTKDGNWTAPDTIAMFTLLPPWYQTGWFISLCALGASGLLILALWSILNHKKNQLRLAMQRHTQEVYEEKVRFLININHELRTPLTLIQAPLQLLLGTLSSDDKNYLALRNVYKQSKRMKDLLDKILNLRKMESGESKLDIRPYPLNEWIKEIAEDYKYEEKEQQVTIKYEFDPAIGDVGFDDDKHIIILTNLLTNAFKHSPEGGTIRVRTALSGTDNAASHGQSVSISVADQGPGLPEGDAQRLFTRFYQGANEKGGIGIGLSYAKILVEQHKGRIGAYNNPEGGACFYYELPLRQATEQIVCQPEEYLNKLLATDKAEEQVSLANPIDTRRYSLLFADDNPDMRHLIGENLNDHFNKVYLAADGKEAFQLVSKEIPDIVISDIRMPSINGYELCRKIKENPSINHIQVILLTGCTDRESHLYSYKTGADAYVEKPFEIDMVLATVRNRLFLHEQAKSRYNVIATRTSTTSADDAFLYKLNKTIVENLENKEVDINFICRQIGVSRATLYNKLKVLTQMGANDYINKLRMEKALELIKQPALSIAEIADRTGFSSPRYFSTVFKAYTGKTPTQYKEELKAAASR